MVLLNVDSDEKFTLGGSEFQTFTTRSVKKKRTLTDPYPVFKLTAFLKSNISKMVRLMDKITIIYYRTLIRNHIQSIKWYHIQ